MSLLARFASKANRRRQGGPGTMTTTEEGFSYLSVVEGERRPDWCKPLDRPKWLTVEAATHMREDDPVIGYVGDSDPLAFPWWVMKNHHVANLVIDGKPLLIAFCEACSGAAAYDPVVAGRLYTFQVEGLYDSVILLIDRQEGNLWSPFTGHVVHGPARGTRMDRRPVIHCTWAEWKSLYPTSLVLDGKGENRDGHGSMHLNPESGDVGAVMRGTTTSGRRLDTRLQPADLVLGVEAPDQAVAYPLATITSAGGVLNTSIGDVPVAVIAKPGSWVTVAYNRRLGDDTIELGFQGDQLVDLGTGSEFDFFGRATSGPLTGARLGFVPSGLEKWRAWTTYHPGSELRTTSD